MTAETPALENILAWQGLQVPLREEWRPLKVEGKHKNGAVTIGDINGPIFQLRWLRPPKGYDGEMWIKERRKKTAGGQKSTKPPRPDGFEHVSWIKDLAIREEDKKTVWWGSSTNAEVLVEILLTNLCDPKENEWFIKNALPKMRAVSLKNDCKWQIYSARFTVPAGYILERSRLATGDIVLEFKRGRRDSLLLRQVYPARLALQRRALPGWLRDRVFKERRRLRPAQKNGDQDKSLKWTGWKRLPMPLGWILPQRYESMVVNDEELDRLLIVEADWRSGIKTTPVEELIDGMRWRSL